MKERMDGFEETVPEGLWESVESSVSQRLEGNPAVSVEASRKSGRVRWLSWSRGIAAAAVIVLGVLAGFLLADGGSDLGLDDQTLADNRLADKQLPDPAVVDPAVSDSTFQGQDESLASAGEPLVGVSPEVGQGSKAPASVGHRDLRGRRNGPGDRGERVEIVRGDSGDQLLADAGGVLEESGSALEASEEAAPAEDVENVDGTKLNEYDNSVATDHDGEDWSRNLSATDDREGKALSGRPGLRLSMTGPSKGIENDKVFNTRQFYRSLGQSAQPGDVFAASGDDQYILVSPISPALTSQDIETSVRHDEPVRLGVSFRLPLRGRLGLESGLAYSNLTSTLSTVSGGTTRASKQVLDYIGIPVNLTFDLVRLRWLTLYASAGPMVEKCVSAKVRSSVSSAGKGPDEASTQKLDATPLQWSLNAAAGLQLNAFGNIGLFVEPSLGFRFDNGSTLKSAYTERPFDALLAFGLRYTFD